MRLEIPTREATAPRRVLDGGAGFAMAFARRPTPIRALVEALTGARDVAGRIGDKVVRLLMEGVIRLMEVARFGVEAEAVVITRPLSGGARARYVV